MNLTILLCGKTNLCVQNVSNEVYQVFEMTGFCRIMEVSKALRKINLEECTELAHGANGAVYRVNDEEVVKVSLVQDVQAELECELAKIAVSPHTQGHHIGHQLGTALIDYARKIGAKRLYLEGNTKLEASIHLYRKLGFHEISLEGSTYDRCDIIMELKL